MGLFHSLSGAQHLVLEPPAHLSLLHPLLRCLLPVWLEPSLSHSLYVESAVKNSTPPKIRRPGLSLPACFDLFWADFKCSTWAVQVRVQEIATSRRKCCLKSPPQHLPLHCDPLSQQNSIGTLVGQSAILTEAVSWPHVSDHSRAGTWGEPCCLSASGSSLDFCFCAWTLGYLPLCKYNLLSTTGSILNPFHWFWSRLGNIAICWLTGRIAGFIFNGQGFC